MKLGAVALVLAETIFGKLGAEVTHDSVAGDFRDHTRCRNRQAIAIAVDDGGLRKWKRKNWETVDQHVFGREAERPQRDPHRFMRRAQDVDSIDLKMVDNPHGPRDSGVGNELVINLVAALRRELLGIVQLWVPEFFGQNNRGCDYWPGQGAATCFINAGNSNDSGGAQFLFIPKSAATVAHCCKSFLICTE